MAPHRPGRSRIAVAGAIAGGVAVVGLAAAWVERAPIVAHFAGRSLAERHVAARYRIAAIGPFAQRLENVSIGDPRAPDLVARSVDIVLGYDLHGPHLTAIRAEGVRLLARVIDGRVSLGALDRLLPAPSGKAPLALPAIAVTLSDAVARVATPAGAIIARIDGRGVLADGFRGRLRADAPGLKLAGCAVDGLDADVAIRVIDRRPRISGPVSLDALSCGQVTTAPGTATVDMRLAPSLDRWRGSVALAGFAGHAGPMRFGALGGDVTVAGDVRRIEGATRLTMAGLSAGDVSATGVRADGRYRYASGASGLVYAGVVALDHATLAASRRRAIRDAAAPLGASPVGPLASHLAQAIAATAADMRATATVALTAGGPAGAAVRVRTLDLVAATGAQVRVSEGGGFGWNVAERGWSADGRIVAGGGGLPDLDLALTQPRAGDPVSGVARVAPYAAGGARLALKPVRFDAGHDTRFETVATLDGPIAGGRIEGLTVPLAGRIGDGGFVLGATCLPVSFSRLAIAGTVLDPARLRVCGIGGAPLVATRGNVVRGGATIPALRLSGRSGAAPLALAAERTTVDSRGFGIDGLAVRLGRDDAATRLDAHRIEGGFAGGVAGRFEGLGGRIGTVPLQMSDAAGTWRFAGGTLSLDGALAVSDTAASPRFRPLAARDARLTLAGDRIAAQAALDEPTTGTRVADVAIRHDLSDGTGRADFTVPDLTFDKRLQPEMLTPLTLGVIADVAGTVTGSGRIDWTARGVTSSGDFATQRIDLAAAFGPVTGIRGAIHFSDLLGLVTPPGQMATIAEANPGVAVTDGTIRYRLLPGQRVAIEDGRWPFAGGSLALDPTLLDFAEGSARRLTFRLTALDAAAFVQQLALPNLSATGTFDGVLPMVFDQKGGRIAGGSIVARPPGGTIAYVGELSQQSLGTMGKFAFDALKAIRYSSLSIALDGRLDGEIVSRVAFTGVRQATPDAGLVARLIRNLPFTFNISLRAPFRALLGTARSYADPSLLLPQAGAGVVVSQPPPIQPSESEPVR